MSDTCPTVKIKAGNSSGHVIINESDFDAAAGHERYIAQPPVAVVVPPPLPASPADPLATLPPNWRDTTDTEVLRTLAAGIDGRNPENREQAVQMIEAKLVAK